MRHFSCLAVALLSCAAGVNGQVQQVVAQRFQFSDCTGQSTRSKVVETCVNQDPTPPREGYAARNQAYGSSYYSQYSQAYSNYYGYSQQRSKRCTSICGAPLTAKQNSTATNTTTLCENQEAVWSRQNRDGQFVDAESVQYSCRVSYGWGDGLSGAVWALFFLFYSFCLIVYLVVLVCVLVCVAPRQGFSTPLHGCFGDLWTCFLGLCCPCVAWGKVAQAANPANHWLFMSAVFACCHNLACCLGIWNRHEFRRKFNIRGNLLEDCCIHTVAQPCALCQELREAEAGPNSRVVTPLVQSMHVSPMAGTNVELVCPEGVTAGQCLTVDAANVGRCTVQVPAGVKPGQSFVAFAVPAQAPVVMATVVTQNPMIMRSK